MSERRKVFFEIEKDPDGFPPVEVESVWAEQASDGTYVLDNIPFFARSATLGDAVSVEVREGRLWYGATVRKSRNSLLRVVVFRPHDPQVVRRALDRLGCATELSENDRIIAVSVPSNVDLATVREHLATEAAAGILDYEEPILRH